jgi:hypothetical protein
MRIFPPPLYIGDREGFAPEKDIFQRAEFGKGIANLLASSSDPLVVVLDAPWGSGKTTFIKMLAGHLRNEGFPVIYFDAFENDHVDDGFLTVAGEVICLSDELGKSTTPSHKKFVKTAARAGSILLRMGAKIGVKAATLGAIDVANFDELKSVASDIAKETSTKADEYVAELLRLQSQEHKTLSEVKTALTELASQLGSKNKLETENQEPKPLVFIVDELDRCKPPFALELLEKIKHIFSIPNVHFVLSTHLAQLESSVRFSYGSDVDARTYLQKFYNVVLHFPERGTHIFERNIPRYFNYLSDALSVQKEELDLVRNVSEARHLSLRTIERIVSCVAIARMFTPKNYLWLNPIISGLSIMKILDAAAFQRALMGQITLEEVKAILALEKWPSDSSGSEWTLEWWTFCLAKNEADFPDIDWKGFRQSLFQYSIRERKAIVSLMAGHIDRLQNPGQ